MFKRLLTTENVPLITTVARGNSGNNTICDVQMMNTSMSIPLTNIRNHLPRYVTDYNGSNTSSHPQLCCM